MTIQDIVWADLVSWLHARNIVITRDNITRDYAFPEPYRVEVFDGSSRRFATVEGAFIYALAYTVGPK